MNSGVVSYHRGWWKAQAVPAPEPRKEMRPRTYPVGTKMLTTKEAASELGVSLWTCLSYIRAGELEALPKKKGYQVPEAAINRFREFVRIKRQAG